MLFRSNREFKSGSQHLFIIIDACYSGSWVELNEKEKNYRNGISVLSSVGREPANDHPTYGGTLIFGLRALNDDTVDTVKWMQDFKDFLRDHVRYYPRFSGSYYNIVKRYNLHIFHDRTYQKHTLMEIPKDDKDYSYDNDENINQSNKPKSSQVLIPYGNSIRVCDQSLNEVKMLNGNTDVVL